MGVQYLRTCCSINSLIYAAMYTLDSFAKGGGRPPRPWSMPCWTPSLCACQWDGCWHFPLSGLFRDLSGPGPFAHPACSCGAGLL